MKTRKYVLSCIISATLAAILLPACSVIQSAAVERPRIGIAWRADVDSEFLTNVQRAISEAGGEPVLLPQVRSSDILYAGNKVASSAISKHDYLIQSAADIIKKAGYLHSNAALAVGDLKAVVFTGGSDIAPTLYAKPVPWHGIEDEKDYDATRDVSDYLLMDYCLSRKDIAILGICRGEQLLGVVSGATVVQDIPTYCKDNGINYDNRHRNVKTSPEDYRDYSSHSVKVTPNSIFADIVNGSVLNGCPSWHHQMLGSVKGTPLRVTGTTDLSDRNVIEVIERTDRTFAVGIQFHPEAAICKRLDGKANASNYMTREQGLAFFRTLVDKVREPLK